MKRLVVYPFFGLMALWSIPSAQAHSVNYDVMPKGISAKVFYSETDPASYAGYEIFGPGDALPFATGRTDKNGVVSFLPDRAGDWKIKILGESMHGYHGVTVDVKVDQALDLASFRKPLLARHTKLITGISLIFGLFGLVSLAASRRKASPTS